MFVQFIFGKGEGVFDSGDFFENDFFVVFFVDDFFSDISDFFVDKGVLGEDLFIDSLRKLQFGNVFIFNEVCICIFICIFFFKDWWILQFFNYLMV